jgi:hypothetical protein
MSDLNVADQLRTGPQPNWRRLAVGPFPATGAPVETAAGNSDRIAHPTANASPAAFMRLPRQRA